MGGERHVLLATPRRQQGRTAQRIRVAVRRFQGKKKRGLNGFAFYLRGRLPTTIGENFVWIDAYKSVI